jgi:hypothetical protein
MFRLVDRSGVVGSPFLQLLVEISFPILKNLGFGLRAMST